MSPEASSKRPSISDQSDNWSAKKSKREDELNAAAGLREALREDAKAVQLSTQHLDHLMNQVDDILKSLDPSRGKEYQQKVMPPAEPGELRCQIVFKNVINYGERILESEVTEKIISVVSEISGELGKVHLAFVGLSLLHCLLRRIQDHKEQKRKNFQRCYVALRRLVAFWKNLRRLILEHEHEQEEEMDLQKLLQKATNIIVKRVLNCFNILLDDSEHVDQDKETLDGIERDIEDCRLGIYGMLHVQNHMLLSEIKKRIQENHADLTNQILEALRYAKTLN